MIRLSSIALLLASLSTTAFAGTQKAAVQAPTLSEFGLGALVVIVGVVAGWAIGRNKTKK